MPEINIKVRDKCAEGEGVIICNNSDYTVVWDIDEEWTPYDTKTMRVNLADGSYQDVVFTGNTAALPVLTASGWVSVGLYAGDIHTSRAARLLALSSVLTPGGSPAATAGDILAGLTAYVAGGKVTGTLKMAQGTVTLGKTVTSAVYETVTHNLGTVPSLIFLRVENTPTFDSTTTYNVVCGYAVNFASGLVPGVRTNKSAAQCINSSGGGAGDTTAAEATICVADQITAASFRLRTNGSSRCWANGSQIRWIALAM